MFSVLFVRVCFTMIFVFLCVYVVSFIFLQSHRFVLLNIDCTFTFMHTFIMMFPPPSGSLMISAAPGFGPLPGPVSKDITIIA